MTISIEKFKEQLSVFLFVSFLFQCVLFFPVLQDSIYSYFLIHEKHLSFDEYLSTGFTFFSFIGPYFFYWFICSYFASIPGLLLSRWRFFSSALSVLLIFAFSIFSKLDFFIFSHYQFHLGSGLSSWFMDKKYKFYFNTKILNDMAVSNQEFKFILGTSIVILFCYILAMMLSRFLVSRYDFKKYASDVHSYIIAMSFGFFFYFQNCYQQNDFWQIAQVQRYPLFSLFANQMAKWGLWKSSIDFPIVVDIHSTDYQIKTPQIDTANIQKKPNILWIVVDTLRGDVVTPKNMPFLSDYQQQNIHFNNHWSSGNSTQPGIFGMFYSLPENYFSSVVNHQTSPYIIRMFKKHGYQLNVFYSSANLKNPPFEKTIFLDFKPQNIFLPKYLVDDNTDRDINRQLNKFLLSKPKTPFFNFVLLTSVHNYCLPQHFDLFFKDKSYECKRWSTMVDSDATPYKFRYLNAAHYVDGLLKQIINNLKKANLEDNTIVIITSDHGESFNENHNNHWGHSVSFSSTELHVPMTIHWPGKQAQQINYFTSHYDMVPTLLKELFNYQKDTHSYMVGDSLFVPHQDARELMVVGSYFFMGALKKDKYYIFLPNGQIKTYDLNGLPILSDKISLEDLATSMYNMNRYFKK
jgi:membrane-anchored protein YejM (alkaline phosphatase superfamily)